MTPEQMTALAARLQKAANERGNLPDDSEALAADLDAAADLIESMAQRIPLSDEQIRALVQPMDWPPSVTEIVRAVESAHGIRHEDAA